MNTDLENGYVNIVLAFIFSSGKITKFTCGKIKITDSKQFQKVKQHLVSHLIEQMKKETYVIPIQNLYGNDFIQVLSKNLNAINLYLQTYKPIQQKKKLSYSIIFNSGKVTKFTKEFYKTEEEQKANKIDFQKEIQILADCVQNNELYVLENSDKTDYLFILPKNIDSFSVNLQDSNSDFNNEGNK